MTAKRHEDMEPPECDMPDMPVMCDQCFRQAEDDCTLCAECQKEADAINGIYENGTEETATIRVAKFRTTDGRGTCGLDFAHDHLRCPLIRAISFGRSYQCAWTGADIISDNPDGSGYLRPCENCPIHKSP
jgi:hypothetical protein